MRASRKGAAQRCPYAPESATSPRTNEAPAATWTRPGSVAASWKRTDHRAMDDHDPKCATLRALPISLRMTFLSSDAFSGFTAGNRRPCLFAGKPLCGRDDPRRPSLFTYQYVYINGMPSQAECFSIHFGKPIRPHARFLAQMHGGVFLTDARIPYRKRRSVTVRSVGIAIGGEIGPVQPHSPCQIVMPSNERTPAFRKASKGEPQIG